MYTYDPIEMYVTKTSLRYIQGSLLIALYQLKKRLFFCVISEEAHSYYKKTFLHVNILAYCSL